MEIGSKSQVKEFWERGSCGEVYATGSDLREQFSALRQARYALEPYIHRFAGFEAGRGRDVLEIGVGMGCDHLEWAKSGPRSLIGVDLTERAVNFTRQHLQTNNFTPNVRVADAENLPFEDESFDIVYSWGVLHVSPDTPKAIREVHRVLRPNGTAKIMIYHTYSMTGYLLWLRYGLLALRPWRSLRYVYMHYLESPGTKAYTTAETFEMFRCFSEAKTEILLNHSDLVLGEVGQQHRGFWLDLAKKFLPRNLIRRYFKNHGLYIVITARK